MKSLKNIYFRPDANPRLSAERAARHKLFKQRKELRIQLLTATDKETKKALQEALSGIAKAIKNTLS